MAVIEIANLPDPTYTFVPFSIPGPIVSGVVANPDDLRALKPAWDAVKQSFPSPMQKSDWSFACLHALLRGGTPHVLVDAVDGSLHGVAPLVIQRSTWPARASLSGVADLQEPMDLVYSDEASLGRLVERLVDLRMPLTLDRMPDDSPALAALRRTFAGRGLVVERARPTFPFITLSPAWEDPLLQLSSRRRSDLRRAWKRAEAFGEVSCEVMTPEPARLDELFDEARKIEARSWKGPAGTALVHDPVRTAFYRHYAHAACRRGTLRLCWLRFGATTVAVQFAIEEGRRFWLLKIGYDEEYARCSPGNLLICETLRYAARRHLESYEFLGASEDWTRVWTSDERGTVCVRIYPYNMAGLVALARDTLSRVKTRCSWRPA